MNEDQFQLLMEMLTYQTSLLERIAIAVEGKEAPNYQADLSQFPHYDWSAIGATIEQRDRDGVAVVTWRGYRFIRRSATNKFKPAIWFSRSIPQEDGEPRYERLITFKHLPAAEPLPEKIRQVG